MRKTKKNNRGNFVEGVIISKMTEKDIDDVLTIESLSFSIPWSKEALRIETTENKLSIYLSARIDKMVVGYAGMWKIFEEGHIMNIAVHPEYRGNGVGSMLISKLIKICPENKIEKLTLEVRKSNVLALKMYEKFGFQIKGERKNYYSDNGESAIIMWLTKINC